MMKFIVYGFLLAWFMVSSCKKPYSEIKRFDEAGFKYSDTVRFEKPGKLLVEYGHDYTFQNLWLELNDVKISVDLFDLAGRPLGIKKGKNYYAEVESNLGEDVVITQEMRQDSLRGITGICMRY